MDGKKLKFLFSILILFSNFDFKIGTILKILVIKIYNNIYDQKYYNFFYQ